MRNEGIKISGIEKLLFHDTGNLDFGLKKKSPAINGGVWISGFNDKAIGLPDIGPFEQGDNAGPDWPRPRKTVFNTSPPVMILEKDLPAVLIEP
ncbi:MAG: hypothetical protein JSV25_16415 [Spirochaetota bacterium]|nr:MAG: hypothetical protein JSV25_16415 [Spirochaetota bacterium]